MPRFWLFTILLIIGIAALGTLKRTSASATPKRTPVIVELFTSEGCSSCPPADALLKKLEETQPVPNADIIVLGQHVDYWNHLGWTDRFSSKELTERQRQYGDSFNLDSVYTPQMIVDGKTEFNGADDSAARTALAAAANKPKANIALTLAPDQILEINIDSIPVSAKNAQVLLAITESNLQSSIKRGENDGRTLTHTGVVRELRLLGPIEGTTFTAESKLKLHPDWKRPDLHVIVFVQDAKTRQILGATLVPLTQTR
ncbi:MAG: hypothetical protein JWO13_2177 [Acidobacteriales bacterium]|nr:hypothetical protein [Terriglobales bacterium]